MTLFENYINFFYDFFSYNSDVIFTLVTTPNFLSSQWRQRHKHHRYNTRLVCVWLHAAKK